jgi:hypothetical protein
MHGASVAYHSTTVLPHTKRASIATSRDGYGDEFSVRRYAAYNSGSSFPNVTQKIWLTTNRRNCKRSSHKYWQLLQPVKYLNHRLHIVRIVRISVTKQCINQLCAQHCDVTATLPPWWWLALAAEKRRGNIKRNKCTQLVYVLFITLTTTYFAVRSNRT